MGKFYLTVLLNKKGMDMIIRSYKDCFQELQTSLTIINVLPFKRTKRDLSKVYPLKKIDKTKDKKYNDYIKVYNGLSQLLTNLDIVKNKLKDAEDYIYVYNNDCPLDRDALTNYLYTISHDIFKMFNKEMNKSFKSLYDSPMADKRYNDLGLMYTLVKLKLYEVNKQYKTSVNDLAKLIKGWISWNSLPGKYKTHLRFNKTIKELSLISTYFLEANKVTGNIE